MDRLVAFSRRRRRWLLYAAAAAGACIIYQHPAVAARRRSLARLADALTSLADATALVASDLAAFLRSDSDTIPPTLTQLSKLASSPEASASASAISQAITAGILRSHAAASGPTSGDDVVFSDRLLDNLFSHSGKRLASAVAGSFARNLVLAHYSAPSRPSEASSSARWIDVVTTGRGRRAISNWVEVFTATAVAVFIDKTIHINTYDQLLAAMTNPAHDAKVQELLTAICNASVETLVRTSHRVLSNANGNNGNNGITMDGHGNGSGNGNGEVGEGWVDTVSSVLAVPANRRLALDLTGRVTFEAVRSFLEFVLWRLHDGARAGGDAAIRAGLHAMRYISDRSMIIVTICISLCLHVLNGTWLLVPA